MRELAFTPEAYDDIRIARNWYERRRRGLGAAFERALEATLARIARTPDASPLVAPPCRLAIVRRYPYEVFYLFDERQALIVLVLHTARDPKHITARLREQPH
jgi:plasmid stabilization system protein ParE